MRTDELIELLARGAVPVDRGAGGRRFASAVAVGALLALLLVAVGLGVRPDLPAAAADPIFALKFVFAGSLAAAGALATRRLGRPGASLAGIGTMIAMPLVVLWGAALLSLAGADPRQRMVMIFGQTWTGCPFIVAALSVPVLVGVLWALRGMAPTRPRLAGAAAGLLAGALAAVAYALHCTESAAPFVAIWYVTGVGIATALGALAGPRALRW